MVFNSVNILYLCGFQGAAALQIPRDGEATLYVSAVNYEQAKAEAKGLNVQKLKLGENVIGKIAQQPTKFAIDSLPIESWRALANAVGGEWKLMVMGNLIRDLRMVKDAEEVKLIREACNLAEIGMQAAYENLRAGVTERRIAAEVEYAMRKKGGDGTSFDTIIASGPSSAFPHGSCSNRTIRQDDLVIVDLGATYQSYRSDMTRTFTAGKPSEKQLKIYETVKLAQQKAFKVISPTFQPTMLTRLLLGT